MSEDQTKKASPAREFSIRAVEWIASVDGDGNAIMRHRIEQMIDGRWTPIPLLRLLDVVDHVDGRG